MRALLFVLVLLPLWSSYLVRIYSWRLILAKNGALNWALNGIGLPDAGLAYTNTAMWIVFSYVWLPFMVLPVYAALERIPRQLPRGLGRSRRARLADVPKRHPAARAARRRRRLDLHLLADARRLHHAGARRRRGLELHRERGRRRTSASTATSPSRRRFATVPVIVMARLPRGRQAARGVRGAVRRRGTRIGLGVWTVLVIAFLWIPILIILAYAFNGSVSRPGRSRAGRCTGSMPPGTTTRRGARSGSRSRSALVATAVALVLGTAASFAIHRFRFFGRESISFLLAAADRAARESSPAWR